MPPEWKVLTKFLYLCAILSCSGGVHGSKRKIPDFVIKCSLSVPAEETDKCVNGNIKVFKPKLVQGIPEFRIPPLDPLFLESIKMEAANFRTEFVNCSVTGATNFDLLKAAFDFQKLTFIMNVRFKSIHVEGSYRTSGKMFMMQLESQGPAWFNSTNIEAFIEMHGKIREHRGKKYVDFGDRSQQKMKLIFNEKPVGYLENLFPGNEELTRTANAVVNDNALDIIRDMMPIIEEVIGTFVFNSVQTTFDLFSMDELLLP